MPARASAFLAAGAGAHQHDGGVGARDGGGHDAAARLEAHALAGLFGADEHERRAVHDAAAVAGRVHVLDLLHPVVLLEGHGVEAAHLTDHGERGLQAAQRLHGGVAADVLVVVQHHEAVLVLHGHHALGEAALGPGLAGEALRAQREGVHVLTREALERGDQVRADALRHEAGVVVGGGVHGPRAAVAAHGDARHGLHAAREDHVLEARAHLLRGQVHGLEAGGAEAVDLQTGDGVRQARRDGRGLGDARALVTHGRHAAQHQVVHVVEIEVGLPLAQRVDQARHQRDRLHLVEGTVLLSLPSRRAQGVVDDRFGHVVAPVGSAAGRAD
jgi:hypothetical protein